jgi:hypothetical protein
VLQDELLGWFYKPGIPVVTLTLSDPPTIKVQLNIDKREEKNTRKAPACRITPLNIVHSDCEASQNAEDTSRL